MKNYGTCGITFCKKCGKPYTYMGDIPEGGFPKGQAPWCECGTFEVNPVVYSPWKYCPHCGKELK